MCVHSASYTQYIHVSSHKLNCTKYKKRRAEAVSNRGPSAYQPNTLPLGQTRRGTVIISRTPTVWMVQLLRDMGEMPCHWKKVSLLCKISGDRRGVTTVRKTVYSGFSLSHCHRLRNETASESVWRPLRKRNLLGKTGLHDGNRRRGRWRTGGALSLSQSTSFPVDWLDI